MGLLIASIVLTILTFIGVWIGRAVYFEKANFPHFYKYNYKHNFIYVTN